MKRAFAMAMVGCCALAGCTGGSSKPAAASATTRTDVTTTSAVATPVGAATTSGATTPAAATSGTAVAAGSAPSAAASPTASATGSPMAAPSPAPAVPAGPETSKQAAAIEQHFDAGEDKGVVARNAKALAAVESCSVLSSNAAFAAADRAIGYTPPSRQAAKTTLAPAGFVEPASLAFPQQFLYVERILRPSERFTPYSMNVFTRPAANAPWKLCAYPNLFDKVALPRFATIAKNVVPLVGAAAVARAKHAAGLLATYLTDRAKHKVAPPAGLVVPFASCPTKYPRCNPPGLDDPYFTPTSRVSVTYKVTTTSKPTYSYPLANGDTLTIAELQAVSRDTAAVGYLQQDSHRSYWNILLPGGDFHSVTLTDALSVVLEVTPSGSARLLGAADLALSATSTPR